MKTLSLICLLIATPLVPMARAQNPVNPDAAVVADFEKRVADYVQLQKSVESKLPKLKSTKSQSEIHRHQSELAKAIRQARNTAKPGDIFTPAAVTEFRRLTGIALQGSNAGHVAHSLSSAEPVSLNLKVNDSYPSGVSRQSTPPTLLMNLPQLPPQLEFRIVGSSLILLDRDANIVVDLMPNAIPKPAP